MKRTSFSFLLILSLVVSSACGVKGDPIPASPEPLFDNPLEEKDLKPKKKK